MKYPNKRGTDMIKKEIIIQSKVGIHARPASLVVKEAMKFVSNIEIKKGATAVSAKSIMKVLILEIRCGDVVELVIEGPDEENAMKVMSQLISSPFQEY
jgi:phosphocarrier protein